jgi:hypothetical protein
MKKFRFTLKITEFRDYEMETESEKEALKLIRTGGFHEEENTYELTDDYSCEYEEELIEIKEIKEKNNENT